MMSGHASQLLLLGFAFPLIFHRCATLLLLRPGEGTNDLSVLFLTCTVPWRLIIGIPGARVGIEVNESLDRLDLPNGSCNMQRSACPLRLRIYVRSSANYSLNDLRVPCRSHVEARRISLISRICSLHR